MLKSLGRDSTLVISSKEGWNVYVYVYTQHNWWRIIRTTCWVGFRFYGKLPYQNTETRCKKREETEDKHWEKLDYKNTIEYIIHTM